MMVICNLLGKVETKAVHLSQYAHLLRDEGDEGKRNMEAAEEEQQEIEDKETPGGKEIAPIYMKPRAPSVRDDDDGDHDEPLSAEFLRMELQGRGEEMLRIALAPGDETKDGARGDFSHRRASRANSSRAGPAGTMKKLSPHPTVPSLSTAKLSNAGDGKGQVSGTASAREGGRTSRGARQVVTSGNKTSR